ncbi:MAG: cysteine hydrolase family protein [Caldimonas sp.]
MPPKTLRQMAGLKAPESLVAAKTALVLIDFQGDYFDAAKLPIPDGPAAVSNAARLVESFDSAGAKVVHVQHLAGHLSAPLFAPGAAGARIIDEVQPRATHEVVVKALPSAFVGTELDAKLRAAAIDTLVVAGLMTHMCVDATARDGMSRGYKVIVAGDACATRDLPGPEGATISAGEIHRATLAALADRFADVMQSAQIASLMTREPQVLSS